MKVLDIFGHTWYLHSGLLPLPEFNFNIFRFQIRVISRDNKFRRSETVYVFVFVTELRDIDLIQSSNMNKVDYMEVTLPNYSYIFNFEETFSHYETKQWMMKNWTNGFYYCGLYMILIFGGQLYMASRPRFELRGILCLWNTLLATFSIIGFTRTAPELIHVLRHHGLHHSICTPRSV